MSRTTRIPTSDDPTLIITEETGPMEGYRVKHPSFGHIVLHRWSGNTKNTLFQTNVETFSGVSLEIKTAELIRTGSSEYVHGKDIIVRIDLSPAQFADLLTNMNAEGTPCTIRANAAATPVCPGPVPELETAPKRIEADFEQAIQDLEFIDAKTGLQIREAIAKLPAKHQTAITEAIQSISSAVKSHIPYLRRRWEESLQKQLSQAKLEFASWTQGVVQKLGISKMAAEQAPRLGHSFDTLGMTVEGKADDEKS